ncbi:MAG: methyltransferase domain-containing protein [bacterium]
MNANHLKKALELLAKAVGLFEEGNYAEAMVCLNRADNLQAPLDLIYRYRARIYEKTNDAAKAATDYMLARNFADFHAFEYRVLAGKQLENIFPDMAYSEYRDALTMPVNEDEVKEYLRNSALAYEKKAEEHAKTVLNAAAVWFRSHVGLLKGHGFSLEGKDVLEIGGSIIPMQCLLYLCAGARATAIDKFRSPDNINIVGPEMQLLCYRYILENMHNPEICGEMPCELRRLLPEQVVEKQDDKIKLVAPDLNFFYEVDSASAPFEDCSFDLITSLVTLEHVGDPDGDPMDTVREIARLLRPGGWSAHNIGLSDHRDIEKKPYDFLQLSDHEWKTFDCDHNQRANRWRASRWRNAFKEVGLEEIHVINNIEKWPPLSDELLDSFHPDFKCLGREDLEVLDVTLIHRKPE